MRPIKCLLSTIVLVFSTSYFLQLEAQEISVYQYRQVAAEDMAEFIDRETTYWSKVAENAMEDGNLQFWGLFQKVGGFDIPNSPNVLFINTFKDIDATAGTWDPSEVFPNVPMDSMDTFSMSKVVHTIFVRSENWVQVEGAVPAEDFNYVTMVYHDTDAPTELIELENEHWAPFIKSAMDKGQTPQKAWGNAVILSPSSPDMNASTLSFDIYSTLKDALDPALAEDVVIPEEGLNEIIDLENGPRTVYVYQVVDVVEAEAEN